MSRSDLKRLLLIIEQQLDWGDAATWQSKDFERLNELIFEKTRVSLSASTLRRLWGRVEYNHLPSATTLDTLARFGGFNSWRAFTKSGIPVKTPDKNDRAAVGSPKLKRIIAPVMVLFALIIGVSLIGMLSKKNNEPDGKGPYIFNTRPVTRSIPNSVIFTYDVKTNPGDSVFIQQSWDPNTRVIVDKKLHNYTSIYYRPGFYHAKLGINNKVVKEHLLLIPTDGWLGMISHQPVPVYLSSREYKFNDMMEVTPSVITRNNIPLEPQPPGVEYYNVGNFKPVPLNDLSFSTEIKNNYHAGAAACQFANIILFTDNTPVIIPISAKGCVSDLRLLNGGHFISGKNNDLSGFGTDLSQWVKVACRSIPGKIQYFINDKMVYESPRPIYSENVVGIGYRFLGAGSVKQIEVKSGNTTVFKAF